LLQLVKEQRPETSVKSGLMLGLGESRQELYDTLVDLLDHGCELLTMGQYLQPDQQRYLPVVRYLPPEEFDELAEAARSMGFQQVASGPFVRSSYHAREMIAS
jgi:lipoic acid synthetase